MNRILKVVFSRARGLSVVVSELGRACTKSGIKSVLVTVPMVLASTSAMAFSTSVEGTRGLAIGNFLYGERGCNRICVSAY